MEPRLGSAGEMDAGRGGAFQPDAFRHHGGAGVAPSLKANATASLSFRAPSPSDAGGGTDQGQLTSRVEAHAPRESSALIEAWLDDMLDPGASDGAPRGLASKRLDRATLSAAGMDQDAIDRLYRGLYSHSVEFQKMVSRETALAPRLGQDAVRGVHDALSCLNASLSEASVTGAEVQNIDDGDGGVNAAQKQLDAEEMRLLMEAKTEIEIRMQTLMANVAQERRKRQATEEHLKEAEAQILAERGLCDREKQAHAATRLRMEEQQEEGEKVKDWLNQTIENERMNVAKEKLNVERLNSKIGQMELDRAALNKDIEKMTGEVNMAKGEISQLRVAEAKLQMIIKGKDDDIELLRENFKNDMIECERQKEVYDDIVAQMNAAKKMYDEETTTNAKLQAVIDAHVANIGELEAAKAGLEATEVRLNGDIAGLKSEAEKRDKYVVELEEKAELLVLTRTQLEESQSEGTKLAGELESTRKKAKATEDELRANLTAALNTVEELTRGKSELSVEADKVKRQWQMAMEQGDALEDQVEGHRQVRQKAVDRRDVAIDGMARAQTEVEELERKLKNITAERDKLLELNRNLEDDLKTWKDKAKNNEEKLKATEKMLKETLEKAQKDAAAADAKIKKLEKELEAERKKVQEMLPEIEKYKALKKEFATVDAAHKKLQKENETLDKKLQQCEKDRIKAANDRGAAVKEKAEVAAKLKIANSDIDRLTKTKKALEDRIEVLEKRLLSTEEQLENTKAELHASKEECSRLEAGLRHEEEEHAHTRSELDDTKAKLAEANAMNEELAERVKALETETGLSFKASGASSQMLKSSLAAFKRERDELAEMNKKLKEQLENLWAEIDREMRDKSEIAEKMMRLQEEFQLAANMLDQESQAHAMTAAAQAEAEAKLRAEMDAAASAADAARKKREEDAAALARKHSAAAASLKLQRAAEKERKRQAAEDAQRKLDEMSAEAQRKMIEEQLKMISGLERELGKAGEEAQRAMEVGTRLEQLHEAVKEREAEMLKLRAQIESLELKSKADHSEFEAKRAVLEDRLQSEVTARRVRERYAEDLSKKLKLAKLEIIKLGRRPKMVSKPCQTTYAEMWVRNFLDEDDVAERRKAWVPAAVAARRKKKTSVTVAPAGAAATRNTIVALLSEKIKADMAAVRENRVPMQLPQFTYSYFYTRYGLPEQTEERILDFAAAVFAHRGVPEIARFGLSCGLLSEDDDVGIHPSASAAARAATIVDGGRATTRSVGTGGDAEIRDDEIGSPRSTLRSTSVPDDVNRVLIRGATKRTAAADEAMTARGVGDDGFPGAPGGFGTGLARLKPGDCNLLGLDNRHLNHALALDLAELQTKVVPTEINHDFLTHPLAEEAADALASAVGLDAILGYVAHSSFADAMAGVDLGIMVSEEQLPQLHVLLIEACHILHMQTPLLYVKHHPSPAVYPWGVKGLSPALVVTSAAIEVLAPRELQAAMAGAVAHLLPGSAPVEVTAHSVMRLAPELFLSRDGVRPVWPSVIRPALDRWGRFAELSADRAALIVAQDASVVVSAIMKMAAGSPSLNGALNVHAVLDRARAVDREQVARLPQLLRQADPGQLIGAWSSLAVLRARELLRFQASDAYERTIASGRPASRPNSAAQRRKDLMSLAYMDVLPALPLGLNLPGSADDVGVGEAEGGGTNDAAAGNRIAGEGSAAVAPRPPEAAGGGSTAPAIRSTRLREA